MAEKISSEDILSYVFYTYKKPFTGSYKGMRYRIVRMEKELPLPEGANEDEKPETELVFLVSLWPEPFSYSATPEENIENKEFPFNKEGYEAVIKYLNENADRFAV